MTPVEGIPEHPFELVPQSRFELAGRKQCEVFGAPVEVLLLPRRQARAGMPGAHRGPFQENHADRIIATETAWRAPGMSLTGHRSPFCAQQVILWSTERRREPTLAMLEAAFTMEDAVRGTSVVNSIGAAGSITRSHIHVVDEAGLFLRQLQHSELDPAVVHLTREQVGAECQLLVLDPPFPVIAVGVRGPAAARAHAVHHLLECRTSQAFNLIGTDRTAWLVPRSTIETPAPYFPQALGGAEISGRWCCNDTEVFEELSAAAMEAAIRLGGLPWSSP